MRATIKYLPLTGGTRALCTGRGSYSTAYTFTDGTHTRVVAVLTRVPNARGQRRRTWQLFVVLRLSWSPHQVYQRYRLGIEASYRILRQARPALLPAGVGLAVAECLGRDPLVHCSAARPWFAPY